MAGTHKRGDIVINLRRPASEGPRVTAPPYADDNIVAEFLGLEAARGAMAALGRRGIEADNHLVDGSRRCCGGGAGRHHGGG